MCNAGLQCPECKEKLDQANSLGNRAAPKPGDVSLCICCGALLRFPEDGGGDSVTCSNEEARQLLDERTYRALQLARGFVLMHTKYREDK